MRGRVATHGRGRDARTVTDRSEDRLPRGVAPRLFTRDQAAAYCGVGAELFVQKCPVEPMRIGARVLWDRCAIDRWLDQESGLIAPSEPAGLSVADRLNGGR